MSMFKPPKKKKKVQSKKPVSTQQPKARPEGWTPPFAGAGNRSSVKTLNNSNPIQTTSKPNVIKPTYTVESPPKVDDIPLLQAEKIEEKRTFHPREQMARKEFLKTFRTLTSSGRWNSWDIWNDFVTMTACAISNAVDSTYYDQREEMYMRIIRKYSKEEQELFPDLFAQTALALEENPEQDFLGYIYTELGLNSKARQQIFTPYDLCRVMAEINLNDISHQVNQKGFVTIHDCCCGAGATLIAAANVAKEKLEKDGLSYQNHILVSGQDIDHVVAMMSYIQLSLLGVAGYFKIGDSLADPMTEGDDLKNYWFTPMYFFPVWTFRRIWQRLDDLIKIGDANG